MTASVSRSMDRSPHTSLLRRWTVAGGLLVFLSLRAATAGADTRIKTVEYNFGSRYSSTNLNSSASWVPPSITVHLPEDNIVIRSAYLELEAQATVAGTNTSDLRMCFNTGPTPNALVYDAAGELFRGSGEQYRIAVRADVTSRITAWDNQVYSSSATIVGPVSNMHALKLYITYEYDDDSTTQVKTVRFPAYYATNVAASTASITGGTTVPFTYNADIADSGVTIQQQWFEIRGHRQSNLAQTDGYIRCRIGANAYEPTMFIEGVAQATYDFLYLTQAQTNVPGFVAKSTQTLNVIPFPSGGANTTVLSGECVVTYSYSNASSTKTKTVCYGLGESAGAAAAGSFSTYVYLNEGNITLKRVFAKIHTSFDQTGLTNWAISSSIRGQSATVRNYPTRAQAATVSGFTVLHDITEMAAEWVNGSSVTVSYGAEIGRGATGVELFITYDYTNEGAYTESYSAFAGQSSQWTTNSQAHNFTLYFPDPATPVGIKSLRSAYLHDRFLMSAPSGANRGSILNINGTNSQTATHQHTNETFSTTVLYNNAGQITTANGTTYTGNHNMSVADRRSISAAAKVAYTYFPPPNPPTTLNQYRSDAVTLISTGNWINHDTIVLKCSMSAPPLEDTLAPVVEIKPVPSFDGTNLSTGVSQSYTGTVLGGSVTISGLSSGTEYHWQARVIGIAGNSSWVSFGGNGEEARDIGIDLSTPMAPDMSSITPPDQGARNSGAFTLDFDDGADAGGSGIQNYTVLVSTDPLFSVLTFSSAPVTSQAAISGLTAKQYFWKARTLDVAGNVGLYSSTRSFVVDLSTPTVENLQAGATTWFAADPGAIFNVNFHDLPASVTAGASLLNTLRYKVHSAPDMGGTLLKSYTDIAASPVNLADYTAEWGVDFSTMIEGTNYVSVQATDNAGNVVISTDVFFVKKDTTPPPVPSLSSPSDNARYNHGNISFDWTDATDLTSGTSYYVLQVSTDPLFSILSFSSAPLASQGAVTGLSTEQYFWRVRSLDIPGNTSVYSSTRSFVVDLSTPTVENLQAGATTWFAADPGAIFNVNFHDLPASVTAGASLLNTLRYKVHSAPDMGGTLLKSYTDIAASPVNLADYTAEWGVDFSTMIEGTNYVSVQATDNAGNVVISTDVFFVKKDTTPPPVPSLSSPSDNAQFNHGNISFSWGSVTDLTSGTSQYVLQVSTDPLFSVLSFSSAPWTSQAESVDLSTNSYYWRLRARDTAGNYSDYSSTRTFLVDRSTPIVNDPTSGDDMTWRIGNPGAVYDVDFFDAGGSRLERFQVKASTLPGGSGPDLIGFVDVSTGIDNNSFTDPWALPAIVYDSLLSDATNYISVRAEDNVGNVSSISSDIFFVRKDTIPAASPSLTSPGDQTLTKNPRPPFDWTDVSDLQSGTDHYVIELATTVSFTSIAFTSSPVSSQWASISDLPSATYYWRVRTVDVAGNSGDPSGPFQVLIDTIAPVIRDFQAGDDVWRRDPGTAYSVEFEDFGGSLLDTAQYQITSEPDGGGTLRKGWTDIFVGLNQASYTTPWQIDFSTLTEGGTTNYISVRVWDVAGTTASLVNIFHVNKDVTNPVIIDDQLGTTPGGAPIRDPSTT
ncbi:MAG TPA: hypothetical protein PK876_06455 [Elusimicrobiota bacterium]|nr:hypothetical protein [Elusimicrobiota bacterium]